MNTADLTPAERRFPLDFGLDTFGDVTLDADGRPLSHAQTIRNLVEHGVAAEKAGIDFFGIGEHHTDDMPLVGCRCGAGRHRGAHRAHPARLGGHGAQLRRPGAGVPALLDAERNLGWPCRSDPRPRLQHRLVPSVRFRPRRLPRPLRGEDEPVRAAPEGRPRHLGGPHPQRHCATRMSCRTSTRRCRPGSASAAAQSRSSGRPATASRSCSPSSAVRSAVSRRIRICSTRLSNSSATRRNRSACTRPDTSPPPTSRRGTSSGRATSRSSAASSKTRGFAVPTEASFLREIGPDGSLYVGSPETVASKIAKNMTTVGAEPLRPEVRDGRARRRRAADEHPPLRKRGRTAGARTPRLRSGPRSRRPAAPAARGPRPARLCKKC